MPRSNAVQRFLKSPATCLGTDEQAAHNPQVTLTVKSDTISR